MRRFVFSTLLVAGFASASFAAPITGYEALYQAVFTDCTLPNGTVERCENAINAYATAIVAEVDLSAANLSFSALRQEVFDANVVDEPFQIEIDELFELLLPDSGAIGALASP